MECILTLFGFKLLYPNHFFLARGKFRFDQQYECQRSFETEEERNRDPWGSPAL